MSKSAETPRKPEELLNFSSDTYPDLVLRERSLVLVSGEEGSGKTQFIMGLLSGIAGSRYYTKLSSLFCLHENPMNEPRERMAIAVSRGIECACLRCQPDGRDGTILVYDDQTFSVDAFNREKLRHRLFVVGFRLFPPYSVNSNLQHHRRMVEIADTHVRVDRMQWRVEKAQIEQTRSLWWSPVEPL